MRIAKLLILSLLTAHCSLLTSSAQQARYERRGNGAPSGACTVGQTATETYVDSATGKHYNCKSLTGNPTTAGTWVPTTATISASDVATPLIATDAGASDAYAVTPAPAITSYTSGLSLIFTPNTSNTGAATINVNGLGAKSIKKLVGASVSDPADNDLRASGRYLLTYDGTQFLILSTLGNSAAAGGVSSINADTTAAQVISATDASLTKTDAGATHSFGLPYKVYNATITQSGTAAPVATVLNNTLGGTLAWTRSAAGSYRGTLVGAFPTASRVQVFMTIHQNFAGATIGAGQISADSVAIITIDNLGTGAPNDNMIGTASLEIRVWP